MINFPSMQAINIEIFLLCAGIGNLEASNISKLYSQGRPLPVFCIL